MCKCVCVCWDVLRGNRPSSSYSIKLFLIQPGGPFLEQKENLYKLQAVFTAIIKRECQKKKLMKSVNNNNNNLD